MFVSASVPEPSGAISIDAMPLLMPMYHGPFHDPASAAGSAAALPAANAATNAMPAVIDLMPSPA
jgi:hypothetical protein